jgi:methionyl-tRNA formyltransferase
MRDEQEPAAPGSTDKVLLSVCTMDWCDIGVAWAKTVFKNLEVLCWDPGDPYPSQLEDWEGDWIISYRGDLIIKEEIYSRARKGAINFHPAPPRYRGLGSQYYAIYRKDVDFGTTVHWLAKSVDTGSIIRADHFSIAPGETGSSLRLHVGAYCLRQFYEIVTDYILPGKPLPQSEESWGEKLYTNKELFAWLDRLRMEEPDHKCLQ